MRFAARRDDNDSELVKAARAMGCVFEKFGPLDYWRCWAGIETHFVPVEIKRADKVKQKSRYRQSQLDFFDKCKDLGVSYEVWSTVDDIAASRSLAVARRAGE